MTDEGALCQAKTQLMAEYFEKWAERLAFLDDLVASGHDQEALLLACCYIDALGGNLYPQNPGSHRRFVRALVEYSGNAAFAAIHPRRVLDVLASSKASSAKMLHSKLCPFLKDLSGPLLHEGAFLAAVQPPLTPQESAILQPYLWRGTIASVLFTNVRSEAVHSFPPVNVVFSVSTVNGEKVGDLDFSLVGPAARAVVAACHDVSFKTGKYYGHDFAHLFGGGSGA